MLGVARDGRERSGIPGDLVAFVVHGDADDLSGLRGRLRLLGWAQAEVVQDVVYGRLVVQVGYDLELASTLLAGERVGVVDLRDQARQSSPSNQARQLAAELGLTPSSRSGVKAIEPKPAGKLEQFIRRAK